MTPEQRIVYVRGHYPDYLTQKQLAEALGVCISTAYKLNRDGIVPYEEVREGFRHHYRIRKDDVIRYLEQKYHNATEWHKVESGLYLHELMEGEPDILKTSDVARIAGVSKSSVQKWIAKGKLPAFFYKSDLRVQKLSLIAFMASPVYLDSSHRNTVAVSIAAEASKRMQLRAQVHSAGKDES